MSGSWDYGLRDGMYECLHHPHRRWFWWVTQPLGYLLCLPYDVLDGDLARRRAFRKRDQQTKEPE